MLLSFPFMRRFLRLRTAATQVTRAELMDEITLAHARWVTANDAVLALPAAGVIDARRQAEQAREHASLHYKALVARLMREA